MGSKCAFPCKNHTLAPHKTPHLPIDLPPNPQSSPPTPPHLNKIQNPQIPAFPQITIDTSKKPISPDKTNTKTSNITSANFPTEIKNTEIKVKRSLSAMKLDKEEVNPPENKPKNVSSAYTKKSVKYFQKDGEFNKELPLIHSKQRKKTLKFRNSQFLNSLLIHKFCLKANFTQIPKKDGDTSIENPASQKSLSQIIHIVIKEGSPPLSPQLKFYFKPAFLQELLENIYELNTASLKKYDLIYEEKIQKHRMKIYCTNYTTTEKNKVNIFRTEFFVNCHPEYFLSFMNNITEQTKMDLLLDKYHIIEPFSNETNVIYLSYRKTIVTSARDFIYLKHWGKIQKENEVFYCDTSRSIDHEGVPANKNVVRGDIIYSGHVVKLVKDEQGRVGSFCRMYSECDFKVNVPAFISKKFSKDEMKAYSERCIKRIEELLGNQKRILN